MNDPYETLGVPPGTGLRDIEQAYQRLKQLYAEETLATYALLSDQERRERLDHIEEAFQKLVASHVALPADDRAAHSTAPAGPAPDQEQAPGEYLSWLRQHSGLTLRDVSERTKISPGKLEAIETQRFAQLPPPVYLRGFVFEYARSLGHPDPRHLAEIYLRLHPNKDQGD